MAEDQKSSNEILDAVSDVLDLDAFLSCTLELGVAELECNGGSVYLVDGATKTLQLCAHTSLGKVSLMLEIDEGIVGKGLKLRNSHIFEGEDLGQNFVDWGKSRRQDRLRAIATMPVYFRNIPQAVFCFDFDKDHDSLSESNLSPSEKTRIQRLSEKIEDPRFANALNRVRIYQALLDIRAAGDGPARLRQVVADYLTSLLAEFPAAGMPTPDLAYLQLVDRRRGTIRTIQGVGMPLIFQTSLSHSLDSRDVQAHVVRDCRPLIIVGKDPLMDPVVYERFGHHGLVRLWLPLFPFPIARLVQRPGKSIEQLFKEMLHWGEPRSYAADSQRVVANWRESFRAHPPSQLVFGTLELGYHRTNRSILSVEPLTPDFASWCSAKAYVLSEHLFRATLTGSLDRIGKSVANLVWPSGTLLTVAMPNWRKPEVRRFPASADWPAAIPEISKIHTPPPEVPIKFNLLHGVRGRDVLVDCTRKELFNRLISISEEAARVALRLDDHVADLYTLVEEADNLEYFGTTYPDPRLDEILQEICREAAAERCTYFLFEKDEPALHQKPDTVYSNSSWRLLGIPHPWPNNSSCEPTTEEYDLARRVAKIRIPTYEILVPCSESWPVAALPLELTDQLQAVIVLHSPMEGDIEEASQRELEGRIARWVYRLSLRNLIVSDRFYRLMGGGLRGDLAEARRDASEKKPGIHLQTFVEQFLTSGVRTLKALAGLFILYSESATAPATVDRFWCYEKIIYKNNNKIKIYPVDRHTFVGKITESPARRAALTNTLIIYPPNDPNRPQDTADMSEELLVRAEELQIRGEFERADLVRKVVIFVKDAGRRSTMIIIPIVGQTNYDRITNGALIFILRGMHDLSQGQRSLMIELGRLAAEALGQMRGLDSIGFEQRLKARLDTLRGKLAGSTTHDEVFGHFLWGIGRGLDPSEQAQTDAETRWKLSDHAVVWLLAPGCGELVARSGRGTGLEVLGELAVMIPHEHPFIAKEISHKVPKKEHPRIAEFRVWTFGLSAASENTLLRRYASQSECAWLVSFPLVQADNRVIGIVDCLRDTPLRPEEEAAIPNMLRRLSQQICFALERCRFERVMEVSRELTEKAGKELDAFHAASVYRILVEKVREELGATHCDLFLDRDGRMILHGTTRFKEPIPESKRQAYWVQPNDGEEVLGTALAAKTWRLKHPTSQCPAMDHLSPELRALLVEDHLHERLVIPQGKRPGPAEPVPGLLYIRGPLSSENQGQTIKRVKKSGLLTFEHLRRTQDLAVVAYRNAMMARLVERKGWLIGELQHQLGQPLQILHGWCDNRLRDLNDHGMAAGELTSLLESMERVFDHVNEVRTNLAIYAKMSQPFDERKMNEVRFTKLVRKCCEFMEPEAERKGCFIKASLQNTQPIRGYPELLRSAVINLLDNAIKYSYEGREITVALREDPEGIIRLVVENYGVGIPEPDLPRIFEPYFRSKVPDEKGARSGGGIGLAIVRHAIEVGHAGEVRVTSDPPRKIPLGLTAAETAKYPHKTTFTLNLLRNTLEKMWRQCSTR